MYSRINKIIGYNLSKDEIDNILISLGYKIKENTLEVPSWKHGQVTIQTVVEDIIRIYGYDNIPISNRMNISKYINTDEIK